MNQRTQGFTLAEMIVAISILGIILTTVVSAFLGNNAINTRTEQNGQAAVAVQRVIDGIRSTDPASLPSSGSSVPTTVTIGGRAYAVTLTYCSPATYCTTNARQIKADVTLNGAKIFTVETVFTSVGSGLVSAGVNP